NISFFDETSEFDYSDGCIQMGFSSQCIINNNTILTTSNDICIYLFSCTNSTISSNHIETNYGSAIILDGSSNNSIIKNKVVKNDYGIYLQNSHDNIIQDNFILDNYRYGIAIRYSTSNIINTNNLINNFHGGILISHSSDITVYDNQISNGFHSSLFLDSASQIYIINNSFPEIGGINLYYSVSISLLGNSFHSEGIIITGDLKEHWNTHKIERNDINGAPIKYYSNTHDFSVSEHAAQVILANTTNVKIQGLQTNNIRRPLQIGFSSQNTIDKNSFLLCYGCGLYLSNSDKNIISNNILTGEESVAIELYYCMNNLIRYNSFSNNFMGVLLHLSEENIIEKNNFQSNVIQAECEFRSPRIYIFHTNKWNQNYWDDWIGVKYTFLHFLPYRINWLNFDWRPSSESYDIDD
ncbi:MAG: NosD domain-containing protein, partial [Candidatus Thermoplasmatota archaeon]|nr:NosD domain-containing protein [Candidatus Thermoplasmatota archaeon]